MRAKVEQTAGADAPLLIDITADSRFGARPVARAESGPAGSETGARPAHTPEQVRPALLGPARLRPPRQTAALPTSAPGPLAAAASTAGSGGFLLVALLLVAITAAGIAAKVRRR